MYTLIGAPKQSIKSYSALNYVKGTCIAFLREISYLAEIPKIDRKSKLGYTRILNALRLSLHVRFLSYVPKAKHYFICGV